MKKQAGPAPFGYTKALGKLIREDVESAIRTEAFTLFLETMRRSTVAEILNAEGHRTRSGTMFSAQTVSRILADPIVLGVPGKVEQIVDQELWDRCQDILAEQKAIGGAKRSARHLFAGLLFCQCGQKMYVPTSSKKYVCADCRAKVTISDLEAVFLEQAKKTIKDQTALKALADWDALPFSSKREVVEALTERLEVNGSSITIHFSAL